MTTEENPVIEIDSVDIAYDENPVIKDLSTKIYPGSFVGLVGPNGAGKTTLLLAMSGQFKPRRGQILFNKTDIYEKNIEFKRVIGYVHEIPFFYPYLTVEDSLHFVADVKGVSQRNAESQINSLLRATSMWEERHKLTSALSMGMRKKCTIAAAMLGSPKILFLDEALAGVDFETAFKIKDALRDFVKEGGIVILSTHILEIVEKLCDRYMVLKNGRIIADLEANEFKKYVRPVGEKDLESFLIKLLDEMNLKRNKS